MHPNYYVMNEYELQEWWRYNCHYDEDSLIEYYENRLKELCGYWEVPPMTEEAREHYGDGHVWGDDTAEIFAIQEKLEFIKR